MHQYIFYTPEGWTAPPNEGMTVENCQLLGFAKGDNLNNAFEKLLGDNQWIIECGYDISQITGIRIIKE